MDPQANPYKNPLFDLSLFTSAKEPTDYVKL